MDASAVRWRCDPASLGFSSTAEIVPSHTILGQEEAVDALKFGLKTRSRGSNVFVRGLSGFGRMALIHQMIEAALPSRAPVPDRCYVYNFTNPDHPILINLTTGAGPLFAEEMEKFAEFVSKELPEYLSSERIKEKQKVIAAQAQSEIQKIGGPFDAELHDNNLAMVPIAVGQNTVPAILPVIDGTAVQFDEIQRKRADETLSEADFNALIKKIEEFEQKFQNVGQSIAVVQQKFAEQVQQFFKQEASTFAGTRIQSIKQAIEQSDVADFLDNVLEDLISHRLGSLQDAQIFSRSYRVNLIHTSQTGSAVPVISESNPTLPKLAGQIDREFSPNMTNARSDHLMIKPGVLLDADGGFLILDAQEILSEPQAWNILLRTLKSGTFEVANTDAFGLWASQQLKPDPIPIDIKVVLVGEPDTYALLDMYEPRFSNLFKVLADFSDTITRDEVGFKAYANVIARIVERDGLPPFTASAVAALIEHGARVCAQQGRLTSRFGRIADIAREAAFLAEQDDLSEVSTENVANAVSRSKGRAEIPARRFRRLMAEGTLRVEVTGQVTGQINGLAVTAAGPLTYGFPSRITASIGPGSNGAVNIEHQSDLSGSVHTKGFLILTGLLRYSLALQHPLAFSSSIAFEQTYGGIDGDSASAAEYCCLMSTLTGLPIRQDLAMTGAVDQRGNILAIGAGTEKIEGFFDACMALEFTGTQGVIIPAANARELMVRADIVEAIAAGNFRVYAIDRIEQALEILLDNPAGQFGDDTEGTTFSIARKHAHDYWETARSSHRRD